MSPTGARVPWPPLDIGRGRHMVVDIEPSLSASIIDLQPLSTDGAWQMASSSSTVGAEVASSIRTQVSSSSHMVALVASGSNAPGNSNQTMSPVGSGPTMLSSP